MANNITTDCSHAIYSLTQEGVSCTRMMAKETFNPCFCGSRIAESLYSTCNQPENNLEYWYSAYVDAFYSRAHACSESIPSIIDNHILTPPPNVTLTSTCFAELFALNKERNKCVPSWTYPSEKALNFCKCQIKKDHFDAVSSQCSLPQNTKEDWFQEYSATVALRDQACANISLTTTGGSETMGAVATITPTKSSGDVVLFDFIFRSIIVGIIGIFVL
ncbi:UNVERIFIED_CONTAM: hypothetical protein HDU68_003589 [Siphonaria sp. JEL0065]|nr:hypothetical protein HDU68_003589 [Siphonaria sp. JEL0065]